MRKPTVAVDFDSVIHSYSSGWQGAKVIPDPPVPGAIDWLLQLTERADVVILSSRARTWGGRRAMRRWLREHVAESVYEFWMDSGGWPVSVPRVVFQALMEHDLEGKTEEEKVVAAARDIVKHDLTVTATKPGAVALLDDRAVRFEGTFPAVDDLLKLRPWNR